MNEKRKLIRIALNSYLSLRRLVLQRTNLVDSSQELMLLLLEDLTTGWYLTSWDLISTNYLLVIVYHATFWLLYMLLLWFREKLTNFFNGIQFTEDIINNPWPCAMCVWLLTAFCFYRNGKWNPILHGLVYRSHQEAGLERPSNTTVHIWTTCQHHLPCKWQVVHAAAVLEFELSSVRMKKVLNCL